MKVQLNTNLVPLFSGTYESIWDVTAQDDNGDELEVEYKHEDLMKSIAETYQAKQGYILSELNSPFITNIKFLGTFANPREYNFKTDVLDFEVNINKAKMLETLRILENSIEFEAYLKENFTSYDGFMSFTPDNYTELMEQVESEGREFEQSIGALITYLAKSNIRADGGCSIEDMVHEDWQGNGYGGLDYTIGQPYA